MRKYRSILIGNGLAQIPAKICSIAGSSLKSQIGNGCGQCNGDVGKKNYCKECGVEPTNEEIIKLLKISKTERIPVSSELQAQLSEQDKKIEVLGSITRDKLDGIVLGMTDNVYYIFEDEKMNSPKPLSILKYGIENSDTLLVVNCSITGTAKVGLIRSEKIQGKNVLLLQLVKYMQYANKIDEDYTATLSPDEQKMGVEFVKSQLKPIDLTTIQDPSAEIMQKILDGDPMVIEVQEKKAKDELAFFKVNK
jgi:non-homologous end joining protein Ku